MEKTKRKSSRPQADCALSARSDTNRGAIDNQLRGRAGRQGDPGASVFYLSFEDSLLRIFATRRVASMMEKLKIEEDEAIEARMVIAHDRKRSAQSRGAQL